MSLFLSEQPKRNAQHHRVHISRTGGIGNPQLIGKPNSFITDDTIIVCHEEVEIRETITRTHLSIKALHRTFIGAFDDLSINHSLDRDVFFASQDIA